MPNLRKARFKVFEANGSEAALDVQYNPNSLTFVKKPKIADIPIPGLDAPLKQYVRGETETLSVELFFDTTEKGTGAGAKDELDAEVERVRIHGGFLRYGVDVDEDHFPFETPLAKLLDYGKGCYVGQEPVFRVHAQGNAAKALRGFRIDGTAPLAAGAAIKHPAKDNAGTVTSSIVEGIGTIALGYLHRTAWNPGDAVEIDGRRAITFELPWD